MIFYIVLALALVAMTFLACREVSRSTRLSRADKRKFIGGLMIAAIAIMAILFRFYTHEEDLSVTASRIVAAVLTGFVIYLLNMLRRMARPAL